MEDTTPGTRRSPWNRPQPESGPWLDRTHRLLARIARHRSEARSPRGPGQLRRQLLTCVTRLGNRSLAVTGHDPRIPRPVSPRFMRKVREAIYRVDVLSGPQVLPAAGAKGLLALPQWGLVFDLVQRRIGSRARQIDLKSMDLMSPLIEALIDAGPGGIDLRGLYRRVWKSAWINAAAHTSTVHFSLHRLRSMLRQLGHDEVLRRGHDGGYFLALPRDAIAVRVQFEPPERPAAPADDVILRLAGEQGFISNRDIRTRTGWSRSTILRRTRELVERGLLVPAGRGRGAHFTRAPAPAGAGRREALPALARAC